MQNTQQIQNQVKLLLTKHSHLRNPYQRKQMIVEFWKMNNEFDGDLSYEIFKKMFPKLTSAETISRCVRAIQQKNPELKPTPEQEQARYEMANQFRMDYKK